MKTSPILAAALAFAITLTLSCTTDGGGGGGGNSSGNEQTNSSSNNSSGSNNNNQTGIIKGPSVSYGNETYETVVIGTQTWMARNLNYNAAGSRCYGERGKVWNEETNKWDITLSNSEIQANCDKYGRLYNWATAKTACPKGWHLPNDAEWNALVDFAGGYINSTTGTKLKARSGWNEDGNGTDDYGFSALPGGIYIPRAGFESVGDYGYWWSASEYGSGIISAYIRGMYYNYEGAGWDYHDKDNLISVRCLQD